MGDTSFLYQFIEQLIGDFQPYMSDTSYDILITRCAETISLLFVGGCISALWGCFGALTALRRSKRG